MREHWWWRPGWRIGRRAYTFHITFDDDAAVEGSADLRRLVSDYQQALATLGGLDLVPLQWLHLTMQNVGFTDEVSEKDIESVLATARDMCSQLPAFELTFDRAEVRREAIAMRPSPAEPVSRLRGTVRAAIGTVLGEVPEAPEHAHGFEPHVSMAYSNREGPVEPYAAVVKGIEPVPAIVGVRAVKLIVLDRDERVYRWRTIGNVPLRTMG
jgi:2'-5' RNA ligase